MRGHVIMSQKERKVVLEQVKEGYFVLKEAAIRMQLSYRHAK